LSLKENIFLPFFTLAKLGEAATCHFLGIPINSEVIEISFLYYFEIIIAIVIEVIHVHMVYFKGGPEVGNPSWDIFWDRKNPF
jgi:hypothetical protein